MSEIKVKLGKRLSMCSEKVRKGSLLADIGTDHAYLPVSLVKNGCCPSAIAADIGKGPLANAAKIVEASDLCEKIQLRLSDGLEKILQNEAEDIVIAGMGGILITEILSDCKWINDGTKRLILQPMSHSEDVRKYLAENGFKTIDEDSCVEDKHSYIVITAEYDGKKENRSEAYYYIGSFGKKKDEASLTYVSKQVRRLEKRYEALKSIDGDSEECVRLGKILGEIYDECNNK